MHKFPHADGIRIGVQRPYAGRHNNGVSAVVYGFAIEAVLLLGILAVVWSVYKFNW
jgi:hypothetical protein